MLLLLLLLLLLLFTDLLVRRFFARLLAFLLNHLLPLNDRVRVHDVLVDRLVGLADGAAHVGRVNARILAIGVVQQFGGRRGRRITSPVIQFLQALHALERVGAAGGVRVQGVEASVEGGPRHAILRVWGRAPLARSRGVDSVLLIPEAERVLAHGGPLVGRLFVPGRVQGAETILYRSGGQLAVVP